MADSTRQSNISRQKPRVKKIIGRLEKVHPDAKLDLDFANPLALLIALILAAQARDDLVNQVTAELFKTNRTAADYASTPLPKLQSQIGKINFYRNKAKSIHNCCKELVERFGGEVPNNLADLVSLPGVGRKTANIVLGNAFGKQTIGVDTHVMRLSQRLGFTTKTDPDKIEADVMEIVPEKQRVRFCHLMQYHGRRVCVAKKPRCPECTVKDLCPYPQKTK
ncbi:MAG TPA: endonuclease III [Candidatus Binatia bacterium]|jgi:endonuclease-3|nr:endonuclease III [Candidatus Binatia bacterium]